MYRGPFSSLMRKFYCQGLRIGYQELKKSHEGMGADPRNTPKPP